MEKKDSFVLYASQYDSIKDLSCEQKGNLLDSIFLYALTSEIPDIADVEVRMAFKFIKSQIDRDTVRYEDICARRREYGKRGGKAKASISYQKEANATKCKQKVAKGSISKLNDNDNDNDNESLQDTNVSMRDNKENIILPPIRPPKGAELEKELLERISALEKEKQELNEKLEKAAREDTQLDMSIVSEKLRPIVDDWLAYKRQKRQTYKPRGFIPFYRKLEKMCHGDPELAREIIEQSKANNYDGIFPVKRESFDPVHSYRGEQEGKFDNMDLTGWTT